MKKITVIMLVLMLAMLSVSAFAESFQIVEATGQVNVRTGPGLNYTDIGTMYAGDQVEFLGNTSVDERNVLWYQVDYNSKGTAWVSSKYSKVVNAVTYGTVEATGGQSNLRTGPSLSYTDIGTMHLGDVAVYLGNDSVDERGIIWYYVEFEGKTGWVSAKYTTLYDGSSYSGICTYVRATAQVNVRSAADLKGKDIGTLSKGEQVVYLGSSVMDDRGVTWYYVQYYSYGTGWVSSIYSYLVDDAYGMEGIDTASSSVFFTVKGNDGNSNIHSGPGLAYDKIGVLHKGDTAVYLDSSSVDERGVTWYYISFEGKTGWVSSKYTSLY